MEIERPDPDALLEDALREEAAKKRGRLKIFLGMAAGVGKTYAMLLEAQEKLEEGYDVVAGYIEPHDRPETAELAEPFEKIPYLWLEHRGTKVREFDVDAALQRRPHLILVDELAHSNAEGARHTKRYQDIEELLNSGIDVYTTLNVQHIESLNDEIAKITGVRVRETIPDSFLENASVIEVVDIPPNELLDRFRAGKVYADEKVDQALQQFFKESNLHALRELVLRKAADRVEADVIRSKHASGQTAVYSTGRGVLACVGPNRMAEAVVNRAKMIQQAMRADSAMVVFVETPGMQERNRLGVELAEKALQKAEQEGMETRKLGGQDIVAEVLNLARARNIDTIVVGKPIKPRWIEFVKGSVVDELVRKSEEIDVHVVTQKESAAVEKYRGRLVRRESNRGYLLVLFALVLATSISFLLSQFLGLSTIIMVYLMAVAFVAFKAGRRESLLTSFLSAILIEILFVAPIGQIRFENVQIAITLGVMVIASLVIGGMSYQLRESAAMADRREKRSATLLSLSRDLAKERHKQGMAKVACEHIGDIFEGDVAVLVPNKHGKLEVLGSNHPEVRIDEEDLAVAAWTFGQGQSAGLGTNTLPGKRALSLPLRIDESRCIGVLMLKPADPTYRPEVSQMRMLNTCARMLFFALERAQLAKESHEERVNAETARQKALILASISHDLNWPMRGLSHDLQQLERNLGSETNGEARQTLARARDNVEKLQIQMNKLLQMAKLDSKAIEPDKAWLNTRELIDHVMQDLGPLTHGRSISVEVAEGADKVYADETLTRQILQNLIENSILHTAMDTPIRIETWVEPKSGDLHFKVSDSGQGFPTEQPELMFEKFKRGTEDPEQQGSGLGLTICEGLVEVQGGKISASNRPEGGARVEFFLPQRPNGS